MPYRRHDSGQTGPVSINNHNMVDPAMPFGGYRQSGRGRERGHQAITLYTETKLVFASP
jgi:phenylacetaldehyde dehydrogenase